MLKVRPVNPRLKTTEHDCEIHPIEVILKPHSLPVFALDPEKPRSRKPSIAKLGGESSPDKENLISVRLLPSILIAVIYEVENQQTTACWDGVIRKRQNLSLVDESMETVTLVLWSEFVGQLDNPEGSCLLLKRV